MKHYIALCLLLLPAALFVASCKQEKAAPAQSPYTDYELAMTNTDTAEVTRLVDLFFNYVENGQLADAAGMLFKMDIDHPYDEPQYLDNDQLQRFMGVLRSIPIVGHRIDYIKFREVYSNEVKVTAIIEEAHDGQPEKNIAFYFKPYDYLSNWRLCVMNTEEHDQRVISNEETDSMTRRYATELEQRQQADQAQ